MVNTHRIVGGEGGKGSYYARECGTYEMKPLGLIICFSRGSETTYRNRSRPRVFLHLREQGNLSSAVVVRRCLWAHNLRAGAVKVVNSEEAC